ncbi:MULTISPECIES: hypothetical protein [Streptomyces]|uniref:Uncharacterized protein n=1 Tax=Streptomyces venezuelae TaxID=54571 RepID=A0A5P2B9M2_STRVZ|nr:MULTISPECIES: hypothetical protein [Streptomyces]MYY79690.1 hypothetical protein [Streptomyces sp. SID335]MYZ12836.1 hypothetical protein [Streptomyces sp. SID337]NDZ91140.1 hypothetical protein [Streptomyces sp. SID10115]NEB43537.1 hypothetical protein [Streptomyces sp. SID339]QES25901.1 hypothetical protein DEJ47_05005 [Streptomyces venezuelae]
MTAILPERPTVLDELPPMPDSADPVILPGLLAGVGLTERRVPAWVTDPGLKASILDGHMEIPDDLNPQAAS